jgi:hypothetical protein
LYVLIAITLAVISVLVFPNVRNSTALTQADRVFDQIEQIRVQRWTLDLQADRSYDAIENQRSGASLPRMDHSDEKLESIRAHRYGMLSDRTYDQVENLRAMRALPY